jgi:hypothetical protein
LFWKEKSLKASDRDKHERRENFDGEKFFFSFILIVSRKVRTRRRRKTKVFGDGKVIDVVCREGDFISLIITLDMRDKHQLLPTKRALSIASLLAKLKQDINLIKDEFSSTLIKRCDKLSLYMFHIEV